MELGSTTLFSDPNIKEYYKLENANADKNSNNLTNTGSVTFTTAKFNNGANFGTTWGNSGKRLKVVTGMTTDLAVAWSMVCWVKETATIIGTNEIGHIIDWSSQTTTDRRVTLKYQDNSGTPRLVFTCAGTDNFYNVTIGTSTFRHLAVTKGSGGTVKLYVDGVMVATGTQGTDAGGSAEFSIGAAIDNTTANGCAMIIDDLAVFNRELTAGEVATLVYTTATAETATLTETITVTKGFAISVAETLSSTETLSYSVPVNTWSNMSRNSSTWTNMPQS